MMLILTLISDEKAINIGTVTDDDHWFSTYIWCYNIRGCRIRGREISAVKNKSQNTHMYCIDKKAHIITKK